MSETAPGTLSLNEAGRPPASTDVLTRRQFGAATLLAGLLATRCADSPARPVQKPRNKPQGGLVIAGGGPMKKVHDFFLEMAGGQDAGIVYIPTASQKAEQEIANKESCPGWEGQVTSFLHTRDRRMTEDPAFLAPLRDEKTTAVWFRGGNQGELVRVYGGTPVEDELHAFLARGGLIGGTSAGAAVMSELMMDDGQITKGFGFFPSKKLIVDQHFDTRRRLKRLMDALNELTERGRVEHADNTQYWGIGVDETTALVLQGFEGLAVGEGEVTICRPNEIVKRLRDGDTVDFRAMGMMAG